MNTSIIPIILCLMAFVPIAVLTSYIYLKRLYGNTIVTRLRPNLIGVSLVMMGLVMIGVVAVFGFISLTTEHHWETALILVWLIVLAYFWTTWSISLFRRKQVGPVVVAIEPRFKVPKWLAGVLAACGALSLIASLISQEPRTIDVLAGSSVFSLAVFYLVEGRSQTLITEEGIFIGSAAIKWERVQSYDWLESQSTDRVALLLRTRGRLSFFHTSVMRIPVQHKDAVSDLLVRHVTS